LFSGLALTIEETEDDLQLSLEEIAKSDDARGRKMRVLELVFGTLLDRPGAQLRWSLEGQDRMLGRRPESRGGIALDDGRSSREHAALVFDRTRGVYRAVDQKSKNGTYVDGQRIDEVELRHGSVIRIGSSILVYSEALVPRGLSLAHRESGTALKRAIAEAAADLAADSALSILIHGPTGAGKEVMAQRIHASSKRSGSLVAVNCATFARELIASELFGHTEGAFSGAVRARSGLFAAAEKGTLFLDEIAELPLELQATLLRALEERKIRPVGSDTEIPVDVRLIAATHQSLEQLSREGKFRADLLARLAGFVIDLPALRERREEILPLFRLFLGQTKKQLAREAAEALLLADWPKNVRELRHAAEHAKLLTRDLEEIDLSALPPAIFSEPAKEAPPNVSPENLTKKDLEKLLKEHAGNISEICRVTGKHRQQIYRLLTKFKLTLDDYRAEESEEP
jgi:transcriptional regulator of acetoin/glycerol metabolism